MRSGSSWSLVFVAGLACLPAALGAQSTLAARDTTSWPAPASPRIEPETFGAQQVQRLPVYDDAGEVIPFEAIQARVDPSGLGGALALGGLGGLVGLVLGAALATTDCDVVRYGFYIHCSPREDALNARLPPALGLLFTGLGMWLGWESDETSFDEALVSIRRERGGRR